MKKAVYEHNPKQPLEDDEYDGMEDMLGDDILPTDWDALVEDAPHEAWYAKVEAEEATKKKETTQCKHN